MKHLTFVMIKPDAIRRGIVSEIIRILAEHDLSIELFDFRYASTDLIHLHYAKKIKAEGDSFREKSTNTFHNKPVIPMILSNQNPSIIDEVRRIIGSTDPRYAKKSTIRGKLGIDSMERSEAEMRCCENLIHASDSVEAFSEEINIWFKPDEVKYITSL